jgi:CHAD domain-containing protein
MQKNVILFNTNSPLVLCQQCPIDWRFVADLPAGPVKNGLADVSSLRALLPTGSGNLHVARLILRDDEEKIHVRGSLYGFELGGRFRTFGITQPLQGYKKAHRLLIEALIDQGGQVLTPEIDLYAALGVSIPIYKAKPEIYFDPNGPVYETVRRIISTFLQVARQNESGIKADHDTEFLHDYRVSLRKVRSMLSLCKGVYSASEIVRLKEAFAEIMKQTNRLRDLDVYLLAKAHYFSLVPESVHEGLNVMFGAFAEDRQQQLAHVAAMLNSDTYLQTMDTLVDTFRSPDSLKSGPNATEPTLPFAQRLIWKRYKKVCKIARHMTAETPDEEVHALRIQCKKLRYLMEFFTPLFPKKTLKLLVKALKRLQDNLGRFNDYSVQQRSLQTFLQDYSQQHAQSLKLAESIGALITVLHQHQEDERHQIMQNFARFDSVKTRTAFTSLFTQEPSNEDSRLLQ